MTFSWSRIWSLPRHYELSYVPETTDQLKRHRNWTVFKESFRKKALTFPKKNISVQLHCHCKTFCMSAIHVNDTEVFLQSHLCSTACHQLASNQRKAFPPFSFAAVLPALTKPALLDTGCIPKDALGQKHSPWEPKRGGSRSQLTELLLSCISTHAVAKHCQAQATWNIFPNFFSMWKHYLQESAKTQLYLCSQTQGNSSVQTASPKFPHLWLQLPRLHAVTQVYFQ